MNNFTFRSQLFIRAYPFDLETGSFKLENSVNVAIKEALFLH